MSSPMNYDPNLTSCGHYARQTVRLTFGQWDYRKTFEVQVGGNCNGLSVIESALDQVLEGLPTALHDDELSVLILERIRDGEVDELVCEDEQFRYDYWLKQMLIAAEIVAIVPSQE